MTKQRIFVALLTVLVFGAGFCGGLWTEQHRPLPPPPATLMGEFTTGHAPDKNATPAQNVAAQAAPKPYDRAKLREDIEKLRPQIEAYRKRLDEIEREYDADLLKVLTLEQRQIYDTKVANFQKQRAENESKMANSAPAPLSEEEIAALRQRPFENAFWRVSFTERLERTTREYKLDAKQVADVRQLLLARRDKFLALVDSTPPPTFKLTSLATAVQRLDPAAAPAPAPAPATK